MFKIITNVLQVYVGGGGEGVHLFLLHTLLSKKIPKIAMHDL